MGKASAGALDRQRVGPVGVVAAVVTVRVDVPDPVTEVGLNVPVAPVGNPVTVSATAALKPFTAVTVCVYVCRRPGSRPAKRARMPV